MTAPTTDFSALGVPAPLVAALARAGRTSAFPIQAETLGDTLSGRDVLGRGRTGSGKTLAFGIPLVARLVPSARAGRRMPGRPFGLVLAPTRELATQIAETITPLAAAYDMRVTTIYGGVSQARQVSALRAGVDIVVACPGRLEDLMGQGAIRLDSVEVTVLDEADHMADLGFLPMVTRILGATPAGGQRMLFSATLDNGVDKLVTRFLHDPKRHEVDEIDEPVVTMTHHAFEAAGPDEKKALVRMLASGRSRRILFMRTKHHAKRLARELTAAGIPAVDLHGNLSQPQRDRNLAAFAEGTARVLVATDVAARGVHVDGVELVVHVDPPAEHKAYLHRSGRTARAGSEGDVVTVFTPEQRKDVSSMMRMAGITVPFQQVTASADAVRSLVGEPAPRVEPTEAAVQAAKNNGRGRPQGQGGQAQRSHGQRSQGQRSQGQGQDRGQRRAQSSQRSEAPARRSGGARRASSR